MSPRLLALDCCAPIEFRAHLPGDFVALIDFFMLIVSDVTMIICSLDFVKDIFLKNLQVWFMNRCVVGVRRRFLFFSSVKVYFLRKYLHLRILIDRHEMSESDCGISTQCECLKYFNVKITMIVHVLEQYLSKYPMPDKVTIEYKIVCK